MSNLLETPPDDWDDKVLSQAFYILRALRGAACGIAFDHIFPVRRAALDLLEARGVIRVNEQAGVVHVVKRGVRHGR